MSAERFGTGGGRYEGVDPLMSAEYRLRTYISDMYQLYAEKMQPNTEVVGPWSQAVSPTDRAQTHLALLKAAYGNGHPGSTQDYTEVMRRQQEGRLLTWVVNWNDMPVGMANLEIQDNGVAEVQRTVAVPHGTLLPDGTVYSGQASISAAVYKQIPDVLERPEIRERVMAIEGDLRLAAPITLPDGKIILSGASTQHIHERAGFSPYLLAVPRYQVHPEGGVPHQEVFLQSRLYVNPHDTPSSETIYTPLEHPCGKTAIADIAHTTYSNAYNLSPDLLDQQSLYVPGELALEETAGIHFSTVRATGDVSWQDLNKALEAGLNKSRFVEIVIPNRPENVELQRRLMELPVIALGVLPGGEFVDSCGQPRYVETTIHFGTARPEIAQQMVEVECASDYEGSDLQWLTHILREEWRDLATQNIGDL